VRVDPVRNTRLPGHTQEDASNVARTEPTRTLAPPRPERDECGGLRVARSAEPIRERITRGARERDHTLSSTLPEHAHLPDSEIDRSAVETTQLSDAQPCTVEEFYDRAVAQHPRCFGLARRAGFARARARVQVGQRMAIIH
jgi:hypothetical protein